MWSEVMGNEEKFSDGKWSIGWKWVKFNITDKDSA